MKAIIAAIAVAAFSVPAFAAEPVGKRTPNGGYEYYSNSHYNQGTYENGCILPWEHAGKEVIGYNPKMVLNGELIWFVDCKIPQPVVVEKTVVQTEQRVYTEQKVERVERVEPVREVKPAPMVEQRKRVRE